MRIVTATVVAALGMAAFAAQAQAQSVRVKERVAAVRAVQDAQPIPRPRCDSLLCPSFIIIGIGA